MFCELTWIIYKVTIQLKVQFSNGHRLASIRSCSATRTVLFDTYVGHIGLCNALLRTPALRRSLCHNVAIAVPDEQQN